MAHVPLHGDAEPGQELTHEKPLADCAHWGVAPEQTVLQAPQFAGFVMSVSQPSSGSPAQCSQPGAHDERGTEHLPALHVTAPPTWGSAVQSFPHPPQLCTSSGTQTPLHNQPEHPCPPSPSPKNAASVAVSPPLSGSPAVASAASSPSVCLPLPSASEPMDASSPDGGGKSPSPAICAHATLVAAAIASATRERHGGLVPIKSSLASMHRPPREGPPERLAPLCSTG